MALRRFGFVTIEMSGNPYWYCILQHKAEYYIPKADQRFSVEECDATEVEHVLEAGNIKK
jgi:hypothetical protein